MTMLRRRLSRGLHILAVAVPLAAVTFAPAEAHRRWLLPSATVLSGTGEWVSVDAAASNGLFVFDHRPLPLDDLVVTGPDGQPVQPKRLGTGEYRSIFDVPLASEGTYRIALVSDALMGGYKLNGEQKRWRGSAADLPGAIPSAATDVRIGEVVSRVETFATSRAPNDVALKPTGKGLEMVPITHPNDLVAGEPAKLRFLVDGKPASGLDIEWVEGGTRYRDDAGVTKLKTDADGVVEITATEPGMYYLEASTTGGKPSIPQAGERRLSYTAVLEFLPA